MFLNSFKTHALKYKVCNEGVTVKVMVTKKVTNGAMICHRTLFDLNISTGFNDCQHHMNFVKHSD